MIAPIGGALGALNPAEWSVGSIGSLGGAGTATGATGTGATGSSSFGGVLSNAIGALETSQNNAATAAQGLADGTLSDPTQAVTAVENASLTMDLAAQIRDKLVNAESTIFQTTV